MANQQDFIHKNLQRHVFFCHCCIRELKKLLDETDVNKRLKQHAGSKEGSMGKTGTTRSH